MASYLTVVEFKDRTVAPVEYVDYVEAAQAGWTLKQLEMWTRFIDARLTKRYQMPLATPIPEVILGWLTRIVTWELYLKRGVDPDDPQCAAIKARADDALNEVKEAADGKDGLFEIPLREDQPGNEGVNRGGPLAYSEVSPYTWSKVERELAAWDPQ